MAESLIKGKTGDEDAFSHGTSTGNLILGTEATGDRMPVKLTSFRVLETGDEIPVAVAQSAVERACEKDNHVVNVSISQLNGSIFPLIRSSICEGDAEFVKKLRSIATGTAVDRRSLQNVDIMEIQTIAPIGAKK